ncbi:MAG: hypothetical protein ACRD1B_06155, partial [Thermoanaerobaculia bacterium]
ESDVEQIMTVSGTLAALNVRLNGSPDNGAGTQSYAFTVRKNGADTSPAVTCTISETATSCSDNTNSASFSAGDLISIKSVPSGTPAARRMRWTAAYNPS